MATYDITIQERKGYVPPEAPNFDTRLGRTWGNSVDALRTFGQIVVLVIVALVPWLPVVAVVVAPLWLLGRRWHRPSPLPVLPLATEVEPTVPSVG